VRQLAVLKISRSLFPQIAQPLFANGAEAATAGKSLTQI
jgi:hypothetical protein